MNGGASSWSKASRCPLAASTSPTSRAMAVANTERVGVLGVDRDRVLDEGPGGVDVPLERRNHALYARASVLAGDNSRTSSYTSIAASRSPSPSSCCASSKSSRVVTRISPVIVSLSVRLPENWATRIPARVATTAMPASHIQPVRFAVGALIGAGCSPPRLLEAPERRGWCSQPSAIRSQRRRDRRRRTRPRDRRATRAGSHALAERRIDAHPRSAIACSTNAWSSSVASRSASRCHRRNTRPRPVTATAPPTTGRIHTRAVTPSAEGV